ncbi:unnamed protein product [Rotaria sp. Silwood2]|nr:unnamed protein product [Rotaria sp. Silwood2]CAF4653372.1 unnamed protein product [Rotaria sp. Silwood2]
MNNTSATTIPYASIPTSESSTINKSQLSELKLSEYSKGNFNSNESSLSINTTEKLERALSNIAPFLRDIFIEFSHILTKILVSLHGQKLLPSGLHALKQHLLLNLLYLLCSQEWQNSLQKYTGLAFIELVNEGHLLSHASKDHVVKQVNLEQLCEHFITASRLQENFLAMMINDKTAYLNSSRLFWKLDP